MDSSEAAHYAIVLAIGILVLIAPVVLILLTVGFLVFTGDLVLSGISPLVMLELYLLDLILFLILAYVIYRLTLWLVRHQLPASLDEIEPNLLNDEDDLSERRR